MENFEFVVPTKYIFGQGTSSKCGDIIKSYGYKNVLVVYGSAHAEKSGLLSSVEEQLRASSIDYSLLGGVLPNPRADLVYKGIELGRNKKIDFILAVGGGSVIDTAKAIAYNGFCFIFDRETNTCITMYGLPPYFGKKKTFYKQEGRRNRAMVYCW